MAKRYDQSLMLSIATSNAQFSLIVLFSHSEPSTKTLRWLIQTKLTQKVTHIAQGSLDMITIS